MATGGIKRNEVIGLRLPCVRWAVKLAPFIFFWEKVGNMRVLPPVKGLLVLVLVALLAACGDSSRQSSSSGGYKVGKPYQIKGVWYYPAEDYKYRETGIASWYGPGFHAKTTANGETYDQNDLTAAHRTLPMPSIVRVTNLENGRSIVVRVNDRGPFANNRIIDMSHRGADMLGFIGKGTARVQVEIMAAESRAVAEQAKRGSPAAKTIPVVVASSAPRDKVESTDIPPPSSPPPAPEKSEVPVYPPSAAKTHPVPPPTDEQLREQKVKVFPVHATKMYIQAGAFSVYDNAERLKNKMSSLGNASISAAQIGGREVYRVRLGPVGSVEESDSLLDKAIAAGFTESRIVVE